MDGCFITFEGGEGAGKSTQIDRLRQRLEGHGHAVLVTREPGGSPRAEEIRRFILDGRAKHLGTWTEALLFAAARLDHLEHTIRPALEKGQHVLCDRFMDSTRAYQGALGDVDERAIGILERVTVDTTDPDLTFILDLPVEVGAERARRRRENRGEPIDRFEAEDVSFHETLRQAFLRIAEASPHLCVVIDANRDEAAVSDAVWNALAQHLPHLTETARAGADVA
jgi:dTMP kinase